MFLEKGGNIKYEVIGKRKLGKGLEVAFVYKFYQGPKSMIELKKATQKALNIVIMYHSV